MKRVRSGFFRKNTSNRNFKAVRSRLAKKSKRVLSKDLFQQNPLDLFVSKKAKQLSRNKKDYLRKDILQKQFSNPDKKKTSFTKVLKRMLSNQRFRIAQVILVFVLFSWFSILFIKPTFYLENIRIEGTQEINPEDIEQVVDEYLGKRSLALIKRAHILFLREKKLASLIHEQYSLDNLEFTKYWTSQLLVVDVTEKVSVALYSIKGEYYAIDTDGRVIRRVPEEEGPLESGLPIIYQYAEIESPHIGDIIFNPGFNEAIVMIHDELNKYPSIEVHSYRLKESEQHSIVLKEKQAIEKDIDQADSEKQAEDALDQALNSIAQARTTEEKLLSLQDALDQIEIEKLEEERVEELLREQKEFLPDENYHLLELDVFTKAGWSIRFGHEVLEDPAMVKNYLNIFATLSGQVDLAGEVNEYVDLRFPNRIYYR